MNIFAFILANFLAAQSAEEIVPTPRPCARIVVEALSISQREFQPVERVFRIPAYLGSAESEQVHQALDWDSVLGKKVTVEWEPVRREVRTDKGTRVTIGINSTAPVEQMVLQPVHLDQDVQLGVSKLRENTYSETGIFRETGCFLVMTDRGTFRSNYFHSNSAELIYRKVAIQAFEKLLKGIPKDAKVLEVHDMHTHPRRGYPLNSADQEAFREFEFYELHRLGILEHRPIVRYYAVSEREGHIFRQSVNFHR